MSTMIEVKSRIDQMSEGNLITYDDFNDLSESGAVASALSRLCKQGAISRLQKGKYYKPKKTKFGELDPTDSEILKVLIEKDGYVSGLSAYNRLGLTTQVPNEVTINGSKYSRRTKVGRLQIRYIRNTVETQSGSSELLQLLDALKNIKRIPDSDVNKSFEKLSQLIQSLNSSEQKRLVELALDYKPSVRALVGAILEGINERLIEGLRDSLNPLTAYKIGLSDNKMANLDGWGIQ